ncbi:MAG TPA: hypothetical protein VMU54_12520 [Planctomycetota bacterium]|nr:hypothetical protein [Planctomycetota bacterium]
MPYLVKVLVLASRDPKVSEEVRRILEAKGSRIQKCTLRSRAHGEKEFDVELHLQDVRLLPGLLRRVEAVKGAAVLAATPPRRSGLVERGKAGRSL